MVIASTLRNWLRCPDCGATEDDLDVQTWTNEYPGGTAARETIVTCSCGNTLSL